MRIAPIITAIAERQLGLVAHRQLIEHHVPPSTIQTATASGRLLPMERGVSLVPGVPITAEVRLLAKVLSAGPGAVLSHRSAAWRWGLVDAPPSVPEVSVPRGRRPRTPGLVIHESTDLHLVIPGRIDGLPVTDIGRTILDCATGSDVELLVDAARRKHHISRTLLPWVSRSMHVADVPASNRCVATSCSTSSHTPTSSVSSADGSVATTSRGGASISTSSCPGTGRSSRTSRGSTADSLSNSRAPTTATGRRSMTQTLPARTPFSSPAGT